MNVKRKFRVTKHETHDYGGGDVRLYEQVLGDTWAASPAKAVSNVCWRSGMKPKGLVPWAGDGARRWHCTAEEIGV